jgi:hypothetical protein
MGFCHSLAFALHNTKPFHKSEKYEHKAEKREGDPANRDPDDGTHEEKDDKYKDGKVHSRTFLPNLHYKKFLATVSFAYTIHSVFAIASLASAEIMIYALHLQPSSQVYSVGQVIAIVVAGATILRALWLFLRMFGTGWRSLWEDVEKGCKRLFGCFNSK